MPMAVGAVRPLPRDSQPLPEAARTARSAVWEQPRLGTKREREPQRGRRGRAARRGWSRAVPGARRPTGDLLWWSWRDSSLRGQKRADAQGASPAGGTPGGGGGLSAGGRGLWVMGGQEGSGRRGHNGQELAAAGQFGLAGVGGYEAEVANAHEPRRDDMEEKPAQEFLGAQFHNLPGAPAA